MLISVPLTSEEEAALIALAKDQGVSVDDLLRKVVLQILSASKAASQLSIPLTAEEFEKLLEEATNIIPDGIPPLCDKALSRESIYTREDEWNRRS